MRILVQDFSGHPFQADLSRALADRGHTVLHLTCADYVTGKGDLASGGNSLLTFRSIDLGGSFARYSPARRLLHEVKYAAKYIKHASLFHPDVVVGSNDPLLSKLLTTIWFRTNRVPYVYWLQDLYSVAMSDFVKRRLGPAGAPLGATFRVAERTALRASTHIVAITADFLPTLAKWRLAPVPTSIVENWAPIAELPTRPRDNQWRNKRFDANDFIFMYSGTLGLKHNPALLAALAEHFAPDGNVRVVVVSEGSGADWLRQEKARRGISNLQILPFQRWEDIPDVLAAADALVALLEPDAGVFSVPSKVLTYHCAERPLLAAMPSTNAAARLIRRETSGLVSEPTVEAFLAAAREIHANPELRQSYGTHARSYAESAFNTDHIAAGFESLFGSLRRATHGR